MNGTPIASASCVVDAGSCSSTSSSIASCGASAPARVSSRATTRSPRCADVQRRRKKDEASATGRIVARVPVVALFGGPAGAGKSTLARLWCATRGRAAHIELDRVRELIVHGLADPQESGPVQEEQYVTAVAATCALARALSQSGYEVAVDDVLEPERFEHDWR